jgi:two-component system, NtrC family, sensor kinase
VLTLLVIQGPDKGRRFEASEAVVLVGRDSQQVPLSDNTVSRRHCQISVDDDRHVLTDLGSANGTYVNGMKVEGAQIIRIGDQLRVGRSVMVFSSQRGVRGALAGQLDLAGAEAGMDSAIMHTVASNDDSMILAVPEPSAAAVSNLQILYQLAAALGASFDIEHAMAVTMDLVFEHLKAERGVVLLVGESSAELTPVVVRTREPVPATPAPNSPGEPFRASRTIVDHVLKSGEAVLSSNAMADQRFAKGKSVHSLGIRSALCVPIKARRADEAAGPEILGVIYIDSSVRNYTFSPDQLRLLSAIGLQAGLAVQNGRLYRSALKSERLAAIGETTAALSHSIKNILQALRGGADVVDLGLASANLSQTGKGWTIVNRNLEKIYSLTMNLLAFSRPREPRTDAVAPSRVINDCVETVANLANERGVMVLADLDPDHPPVPLDTDGISQALLNLLVNAIEAAENRKPDRQPVIRVVSRYDPDSDRAVIEVTDSGPGIAETMKGHLFELFHSTKGNRGTGLGLAVTRKIVEEHEGTIEAISPTEPDGTGTTFRIHLPMRRMQDVSDSWPQPSSAGPTHSDT